MSASASSQATKQSEAEAEEGPMREAEEQMVGVWEYRNKWHGLVVGEYSVRRTPDGSLLLREPQSRGGQNLHGSLIYGTDGWHEAQLQHGYACRVRLLTPETMSSQFREPGGELWEAEVVSRRPVERSRGQALFILGASLAATSASSVAMFGWPLGAGVIGLVSVHELGHVWAMRHFRLSVGPMVFIPFVGAAVEMRQQPVHPYHEGQILLAGPLFGSCAALACLDLGATSLGYMGLLLETFNLLPIGALDGGRLLPMLSSWAIPVGLVWTSGLLMLDPQLVPGCVLLAGLGFALLRGGALATSAYRPERSATYYETLTTRQRGLLSAGYLSLLIILGCSVLSNRAPWSAAPA